MTPATIHGSLVVIKGKGVLLTGDAGTGKSDCVLALIKRGHVFVADDLIQVEKTGHGTIMGTRPKSLANRNEPPGIWVHIRGLGILDIPAIFGSQWVRNQHQIDLVIELRSGPHTELDAFDTDNNAIDLNGLGVKIPLFVIPHAKNRDLSSLVEVAVEKCLMQADRNCN